MRINNSNLFCYYTTGAQIKQNIYIYIYYIILYASNLLIYYHTINKFSYNS